MIRSVCVVLAATSISSAARGDEVLFIYTGVSSGTIGGTAFTNAAFSIHGFGDTNFRNAFVGSGWFIEHLSTTVSIAGVGTTSINSPLQTFVNNLFWVTGLSRGDASADLLNTVPNQAAFATWDMFTDIGPIAGPMDLIAWGPQFSDIETDLGVLRFPAHRINGTFQAIVPAPAGVAWIAAVAWVTSRRRRDQCTPS